MNLPIMPWVAPMLARTLVQVPRGAYSFEPKWDGFRSIVFRAGDLVEIGSRNEKPMTRYFPEVVAAALADGLPERCVSTARSWCRPRSRTASTSSCSSQRIHPAAAG